MPKLDKIEDPIARLARQQREGEVAMKQVLKLPSAQNREDVMSYHGTGKGTIYPSFPGSLDNMPGAYSKKQQIELKRLQRRNRENANLLSIPGIILDFLKIGPNSKKSK